MNRELMEQGLDAAIRMAEKSWSEGGIPIGSVLMTEEGDIVGARIAHEAQPGPPAADRHGANCFRRRRTLRR